MHALGSVGSRDPIRISSSRKSTQTRGPGRALLHDLKLDAGQALAVHAERAGRRVAQIDDPAGLERAAVVDADNDGALVARDA